MTTNRDKHEGKDKDEVDFITQVSAGKFYNIWSNVEKLLLHNKYDNY